MTKRVLFVYTSMIVGGSTTSLLGVLRSLDFSRVSVDLMLLGPDGPLINQVPPEVSVVKPQRIGVFGVNERRRFLSPSYYWAWLIAWWKGKRARKPLHRSQILGSTLADFYGPPPSCRYDAAVGFLEFLPMNYVAFRVNATRKLAWLHADYRDSGLSGGVEDAAFKQLASIVFVSEATRKSFVQLYSTHAERTEIVPNLVDPEEVRRASRKPPNGPLPRDPSDYDINLVSNSRIDFSSKALDRAMRAFGTAVGLGHGRSLHWWVIGDGADLSALRRLSTEMGLTEHVTFLGQLDNPFPVLRLMDVFFIPSRYEGKPIAVTEAQILGLPILATKYSSAEEQIKDGVDGLVVENSEQGIVLGLSALGQHQ